MRQISILAKLELINIFSLNVIRHTKDKNSKKTGIALGITLSIILVVVMLYVGALSFAYIELGAEEIVPAYLVFLSSVFTLIFCAFKAGKIIFRDNCYDVIASMPVKKSAIVISRFIRLYVEGFTVCCVVMLPGMGCYFAMMRPGIISVILGVISVVIVPVIPVAVSVLLGMIITGLSSRMKNKALVEALILVIIVIGVMVFATSTSTSGQTSFSPQDMEKAAREFLDVISSTYPPAMWFSKGIGEGNVAGYMGGVVVSVALLVIVIALTTMNFEQINRRLHASTAKHDYRLEGLEKKSVMKAMVVREVRRYFSSGMYVANTIIGPFMAVAFAISLLFIDLETVLKGMPVNVNINGVIPVLFAGIMMINNSIAVSISMEGKEFWIVKTLPVSDRDILTAKMIFSALLIAPFYVVGEIFMIIAIGPSVMETLWMITLPLVIILCGLATGLAVNLKFPKLKWSSDVEVVKQSASSMIGGFSGIIVALIVAIPLLISPVKYYGFVACGGCVVVMIISIFINEKNKKFDFKRLG